MVIVQIPKLSFSINVLEERYHKELRLEHLKYVNAVVETYNKLLSICKDQMGSCPPSLQVHPPLIKYKLNPGFVESSRFIVERKQKLDFFLKRKRSSSVGEDRDLSANTSPSIQHCTSSASEIVNLDDLPWDPAEKKKITQYHPNQRDEVRRKYLIRGPGQPCGHPFPRKRIRQLSRRFNPKWFDQYGNWIEYSIKEDKAFCLCCYLFREVGNDTFVTEGFCSWKHTERLASHVGDVNTFHNQAFKKSDDLMRQAQSIIVAPHKQSDSTKNEHRIRLNVSIDVSRFLLQ
ncbi:hypothetical protein QQ045_006724 [Rhodiola kirilowii]